MNDTRRKKIKEIMSQVESLKDKLEEVAEEEREATENKPESLQDLDTSDSLANAVSNLELVVDELGEIE